MGAHFSQGRIPRQLPRQRYAAAIDAALYCPFGYFQHFCHLMVSHPMKIAQDDGLFIFRRKSAQCITDKSGGIRLFDPSLRTGSGLILEMHLLEFLAPSKLRNPPRFPITVDDEITAQAHRPVAETTGVGPKGSKVLADPDEYLLGQIFRFRAVARLTIA
jgi:hypothetical protein